VRGLTTDHRPESDREGVFAGCQTTRIRPIPASLLRLPSAVE
jgi:hypothetical protein